MAHASCFYILQHICEVKNMPTKNSSTLFVHRCLIIRPEYVLLLFFASCYELITLWNVLLLTLTNHKPTIYHFWGTYISKRASYLLRCVWDGIPLSIQIIDPLSYFKASLMWRVTLSHIPCLLNTYSYQITFLESFYPCYTNCSLYTTHQLLVLCWVEWTVYSVPGSFLGNINTTSARCYYPPPLHAHTHLLSSQVDISYLSLSCHPAP